MDDGQSGEALLQAAGHNLRRAERKRDRVEKPGRRIRDELRERPLHARVDVDLIAPPLQAAVDQRLAGEQREVLRCAGGRADIAEIDLDQEPAVDRDGFVGLVDAVGQPVGQHAPGNALVADVLERSRGELLVIEALAGSPRLDQHDIRVVDPQRVVDRGVLVDRPVADRVLEVGGVPAER